MFKQNHNRLTELNKDGPELRLTLTLTALEAPMPMISPQSSQETIISNTNGITHHHPDIDDDSKKMTIFYGGRVFVLENISTNKANEIMRLANSSSTLVPDTIGKKKFDLSQMRTRSLMRFFEKRNDRIKGRAPYSISDKSNKSVAEDHKSWLQLAAGNQ